MVRCSSLAALEHAIDRYSIDLCCVLHFFVLFPRWFFFFCSLVVRARASNVESKNKNPFRLTVNPLIDYHWFGSPWCIQCLTLNAMLDSFRCWLFSFHSLEEKKFDMHLAIKFTRLHTYTHAHCLTWIFTCQYQMCEIVVSLVIIVHVIYVWLCCCFFLFILLFSNVCRRV